MPPGAWARRWCRAWSSRTSTIVFKPLLDEPGLKPIIEKTLGAKARKMIYAPAGSRSKRRYQRKERASVRADRRRGARARALGLRHRAHYGQPMDIEWAKDGETGELYIVQARPETVQSRRDAGKLKTYS
jgi:pyruvate, water dikinase